MSRMIEFAQTNRTTTHFRDLEIARIQVAYRCMEYLAPDQCFPPKDLDEVVIDYLKAGRTEPAADMILNEDLNIDIGCSSSSEALRQETIELLQHLVEERKLAVQRRKAAKIAELQAQIDRIKNEEEF